MEYLGQPWPCEIPSSVALNWEPTLCLPRYLLVCEGEYARALQGVYSLVMGGGQKSKHLLEWKESRETQRRPNRLWFKLAHSSDNGAAQSLPVSTLTPLKVIVHLLKS